MNTLLEDRVAQVSIASGLLAGAEIICHLRREKYFWLGTYELPVQAALREHLHPGMKAWDVGAFTGFHTLLLRKLAGRGCACAIEPDPENRRCLINVLAANGMSDVIVSALAISDSPGRARLLRIERGWSQTRAVPSSDGEFAMTTLDSLVDTLGKPDLIKLDIEGSELLALKGAPKILEAYRPIWIVELHGVADAATVQHFEDFDYKVSHIASWSPRVAEFIGGGLHHILAVPG